MLNLNNVEVIYDGVILVLRGISIEVHDGTITTVLGANGAGKSTTLKAISGQLRVERGEVTRGSIEFDGQRIDGLQAYEAVKMGIVQVFEGRRVFEHLTGEENLIAGGHTVSNAVMRRNMELVYEYFPRVYERRDVQAGYLSGGEQQMLAIGRALMSDPKMVMLDEPSLGLAPMIIEEIFGIITKLNQQEQTTFLIVEQNATLALDIAEYGYVMENGAIVLEGKADALRENADIKEFYLGISSGEKKSFRDVKTYRRRKRWLG
ncbi:MAG: ABC transporter ATP-binding protein [Alphaproteobacteria bacterium]|nr:ABC transporter ATP-binding protein [Alphaproteobacteria bacterium]